MRHKVDDLDGALLDQAVAKALGLVTNAREVRTGRPIYFAPSFIEAPREDPEFGDEFRPSSRWDHGGPIIEREKIEIGYMGEGHGWQAAVNPLALSDFSIPWVDGPAPLTAAMRAYVASKFGDTVDL